VRLAIVVFGLCLSCVSVAAAQPESYQDIAIDVRLEEGSGPVMLWVSEPRDVFSLAPDARQRLVCVAPCTTQTVEGTFRFTAQSPDVSGLPFQSEIVRIDEEGAMFLRFDDRQSTRDLGAAVIVTGVLLMLGGITVAALGAALADPAEPYVLGGLVGIAAGLGATLVGFWFAVDEDRISLRFEPGPLS
jgi:hypothetical protein